MSHINLARRQTDGRVTIWTFFRIQYAASNFHPASFTEGGRDYACSEQPYQADKSEFFHDPERAAKIREIHDGRATLLPSDMKAMARLSERDCNSPARSAAWNRRKSECMYRYVLAKFAQNADLEEALLATGDADFYEACTNDLYWASGVAMGSPVAAFLNCRGRNVMGHLVVRVRGVLRRRRQLPRALPPPSPPRDRYSPSASPPRTMAGKLARLNGGVLDNVPLRRRSPRALQDAAPSLSAGEPMDQGLAAQASPAVVDVQHMLPPKECSSGLKSMDLLSAQLLALEDALPRVIKLETGWQFCVAQLSSSHITLLRLGDSDDVPFSVRWSFLPDPNRLSDPAFRVGDVVAVRNFSPELRTGEYHPRLQLGIGGGGHFQLAPNTLPFLIQASGTFNHSHLADDIEVVSRALRPPRQAVGTVRSCSRGGTVEISSPVLPLPARVETGYRDGSPLDYGVGRTVRMNSTYVGEGWTIGSRFAFHPLVSWHPQGGTVRRLQESDLYEYPSSLEPVPRPPHSRPPSTFRSEGPSGGVKKRHYSPPRRDPTSWRR